MANVLTDSKLAKKVMKLIEAVMREPYEGLGKPGPLRHTGANNWSRRLSQEHRITYLVADGKVIFLQARYHY